MRKLIPYILFTIYKLFQWTWRIQIIETPEVKKLLSNNESFVIAHWHGDELGIMHLMKRYHVGCIISTSSDGDIMNKAAQLMGAKTVRGSSTRGGSQAIRGILRLKKEGWRPSLAVDGPKGPIYKAKPGVFQISKMSKLPIFPLTFAASSVFTFEKSWNKSSLPLPFSKVIIHWGEPTPAVGKEVDPKSTELQRELEQKLNTNKSLALSAINASKGFF